MCIYIFRAIEHVDAQAMPSTLKIFEVVKVQTDFKGRTCYQEIVWENRYIRTDEFNYSPEEQTRIRIWNT